ncbi:MAG TPA: hypothetical protein VGI17_04225 [Solirubrobacterales bacterium]|jgi:hypothetical protein
MSARRLVLLLALALPLAFAGSAQAYVYWAEPLAGAIGRASNDGTGVENGFIHTGGEPIAVAVNSSNIYWADESAGTIGRANIDGTGVEPNFITGIKEPWGVAVNSSSIFWASLSGQAIGRANLDGTGKNLGFITGAGGPCSIAIDSGHIYWGNSGLTAHIGRASLTGNSPDDEWVNLDTYIPCGMAANSANVFFADSGAFGGFPHEIGRVNINGSFVDKSMIGDADGACGLTVNGSRLYWANQGNGTIGVANTDATGVNESLVTTGAVEPCGVAVDLLSSPFNPPPSTPTSGSGSSSPSPQPASPPAGTVRFVKAKVDKKQGIAFVSFAVNEAGVVSVTGNGVVPAKAQARGAGTVTVTVRAAKARRAALKRTGRLKTKLAVTFTPGDGGGSAAQSTPLTLTEHLRSRG